MPCLQMFDEKPKRLVKSKLHKRNLVRIGNKICLPSTCLQTNQRRAEMQ